MRAAALRSTEPQELLAAAQLALLYVGATGKGAAIAAQDGDMRLLVAIEAVQRVAQRTHQFVAEGVQLLRSIQHQRHDLAVARVGHERHRFPLCSRVLDRHASRRNREETMPGVRRAATALLSVVLLAA